jgi:hypothetical protein
MDVDEVTASPRGIKRKADEVPLTVMAPRRIKVRMSKIYWLTSDAVGET